MRKYAATHNLSIVITVLIIGIAASYRWFDKLTMSGMTRNDIEEEMRNCANTLIRTY